MIVEAVNDCGWAARDSILGVTRSSSDRRDVVGLISCSKPPALGYCWGRKWVPKSWVLNTLSNNECTIKPEESSRRARTKFGLKYGRRKVVGGRLWEVEIGTKAAENLFLDT